MISEFSAYIFDSARSLEMFEVFFDQSESTYVAILSKMEIKTADYFSALLYRGTLCEVV